jgi:hypothetical protein
MEIPIQPVGLWLSSRSCEMHLHFGKALPRPKQTAFIISPQAFILLTCDLAISAWRFRQVWCFALHSAHLVKLYKLLYFLHFSNF